PVSGMANSTQSDSGEISRVLFLNLLWQSKRCSRTAQDISVLTTAFALHRHPSIPAQHRGTDYLRRARARSTYAFGAEFLRHRYHGDPHDRSAGCAIRA